MFHLDGQVGFDAGDRRQEMVQDLLGGRPEFAAARADFQPAVLVAVIALGEIFGAHRNDLFVVGEFHVKRNRWWLCSLTKLSGVNGAWRRQFCRPRTHCKDIKKPITPTYMMNAPKSNPPSNPQKAPIRAVLIRRL